MVAVVGTKGVARDMKKICSGTRRDQGIKWFTELSDKGKTLHRMIVLYEMINVQKGTVIEKCMSYLSHNSKSNKNPFLLCHEEQ